MSRAARARAGAPPIRVAPALDTGFNAAVFAA